MSSKSLLLTRSRHDETNNYLYYWAEIVLQDAESRKITTFDLADNKAIKDIFESYLKKNNPEIIFLNGHGSETVICGYDNEVLLDQNISKTFMVGSIIYALSCSAATILGKSLVNSGVAAFIGYRGSYEFLTDGARSTTPTRDPVAALFLEPSNLVMLTLLKGNTVEDSYGRARRAYIKKLRFALSDNASPDQRDAAQYLWVDINNFTFFGDSSSRF